MTCSCKCYRDGVEETLAKSKADLAEAVAELRCCRTVTCTCFAEWVNDLSNLDPTCYRNPDCELGAHERRRDALLRRVEREK